MQITFPPGFFFGTSTAAYQIETAFEHDWLGEKSRDGWASKDYVKLVHDCMQKGVDIKGYYFWSTFDNFEWDLGSTFRFGLYETDIETKTRTRRPSAEVFHRLAYGKQIEI